MKGTVTIMDVHDFIEKNTQPTACLTWMENPDVDNDLHVKAVMGLEGLKDVFLSDLTTISTKHRLSTGSPTAVIRTAFLCSMHASSSMGVGMNQQHAILGAGAIAAFALLF
jgi:hypothetical protein